MLDLYFDGRLALGKIHFPHSAGADSLDDPAMPDHGALQKRNMGLPLTVVAMIFRHKNIPA